jgi:hypothetical protein
MDWQTKLHAAAPAAAATQVVSWLDLVDLCRELDDALIHLEHPGPAALALHNAVLTLALGAGTWLLHQIDLKEVDPSCAGQTHDALSASLELVRILHRTRHAQCSNEEIASVQRRIFHAAA